MPNKPTPFLVPAVIALVSHSPAIAAGVVRDLAMRFNAEHRDKNCQPYLTVFDATDPAVNVIHTADPAIVGPAVRDVLLKQYPFSPDDLYDAAFGLGEIRVQPKHGLLDAVEPLLELFTRFDKDMTTPARQKMAALIVQAAGDWQERQRAAPVYLGEFPSRSTSYGYSGVAADTEHAAAQAEVNRTFTEKLDMAAPLPATGTLRVHATIPGPATTIADLRVHEDPKVRAFANDVGVTRDEDASLTDPFIGANVPGWPYCAVGGKRLADDSENMDRPIWWLYQNRTFNNPESPIDERALGMGSAGTQMAVLDNTDHETVCHIVRNLNRQPSR